MTETRTLEQQPLPLRKREPAEPVMISRAEMKIAIAPIVVREMTILDGIMVETEEGRRMMELLFEELEPVCAFADRLSEVLTFLWSYTFY